MVGNVAFSLDLQCEHNQRICLVYWCHWLCQGANGKGIVLPAPLEKVQTVHHLLKLIFFSLQKGRLEGVAWRLLLLLLWWPSRWMDNQTRCPWIKRSGTGRRQAWRCENKSVWEVKGKVIRVYFSPKRRQELHPWTLTPFTVSLLETGLHQAQQTVVPIALKSLTIKQIEAGCFVRLAEGKRAH